MKAFVLDGDNGIVVFGSLKDALAAARADNTGASAATNKSLVFRDEAGLADLLKSHSGAAMVEIFNSFTGVTPVKKFMDRNAAARRIWRECEKMQVEVKPVEEEAEPMPEAKPAKAKKPRAAKPAGELVPKGTGPRDGSKLAQVLEMLKREGGATLEEIMAAMEWQVHTTRALMSAGGAYAKKYGITVISEDVDGKRTFRVA